MVQTENASKAGEKKTENHFTIETAIRKRFERNGPNGNCIWARSIVCGHEKGQRIHFEHTWVEPGRATSSRAAPAHCLFILKSGPRYATNVRCAKWTQSHCIDCRRAQSKISVDGESIPIRTFYDMQTSSSAASKPFGRDKCISLSHRSAIFHHWRAPCNFHASAHTNHKHFFHLTIFHSIVWTFKIQFTEIRFHIIA